MPTARFDREAQTSKLIDLRQPLDARETAVWFQEHLSAHGPFLVTKFGSTEVRSAWRFKLLTEGDYVDKATALLTKFEPPFWAQRMFRNLSLKSGYFPISRSGLKRFTDTFVDCLSQIDLFGSWVPGEGVFADFLPQASVTEKKNLSPLYSPDPWTRYLGGKKVLVIHPFKRTIEAQIPKMRKLYSDDAFLPSFDIEVVRADQTRGFVKDPEKPWFDRLNRMIEESLRHEFDLAIVGCGSYGLPLSAALKSAGRPVIHLGGETQILFGIRGKRWDSLGMYNTNWVSPRDDERPSVVKGFGSAPYW